MRTSSYTPSPLFRRITAVGMAVLVFTLGLLSAAPLAHKHLHDDADHADHQCAVVFLAAGVTLTTSVAVVPAPESVWHETFLAAPKVPMLVAPAHLLPLQCGPPAQA